MGKNWRPRLGSFKSDRSRIHSSLSDLLFPLASRISGVDGWMWVQLRKWSREMHTPRWMDGAARGFLGALLERFPESQGYAAFLSRSHQRNRTSCFLLVGRVDRVSGPDPSTELSFERSAMLPSSEKAAHSLDSHKRMWVRNAACQA